MVDLTPYSTARPFFGPLESWLPPDDAERIAAYQLYESIYKNVPDAFKIIQRGNDANPFYVPSAKTIIEAKNRYLAKRWTFAMDPRIGTDADRAVVSTMLTNLFRREAVWSKFATQKRFGLIRGDQVWHIVADETKPAGKRLSLYELDPASYFPIEGTDGRITGCHIVEPMTLDSGKSVIRRQTYRKTDTGGVSYELTWWETSGWDDRPTSGQKLKKASGPPDDPAVPLTMLPPAITAIPVYHIKNSREPNQTFGVSELMGMERIIGAINQAISDEELTLALEGLGLYSTTSGPPVDDDGNETNWRIGPGWVVEIDQDAVFKRVNGVVSVAPVQEHIQYLETKMREAAGIPDIALGSVDVQTAESGVALAFKMAPILSGNEEKEQELLSVMDHLLYDLTHMWMPTYEGLGTVEAQAVSIVDDPLPVNRKATLDEIITMLTNQIITIQYAQQIISEKLGYEFPDEMLSDIVTEQKALALARNADPFASRVEQELGNE